MKFDFMSELKTFVMLPRAKYVISILGSYWSHIVILNNFRLEQASEALRSELSDWIPKTRLEIKSHLLELADRQVAIHTQSLMSWEAALKLSNDDISQLFKTVSKTAVQNLSPSKCPTDVDSDIDSDFSDRKLLNDVTNTSKSDNCHTDLKEERQESSLEKKENGEETKDEKEFTDPLQQFTDVELSWLCDTVFCDVFRQLTK